MKIGLITTAMDTQKAGVGWYCYNLIKNLNKIDSKNEYVLIHRTKSSEKLYRINKELIVPYPRVPLKITIGDNLQLPMVLKKEGFDVVHELSQIGPFLFNFPFKKVLTIHDVSAILFPETFDTSYYIQHRYLLPLILKNVDVVITVSRNTKKDIVRIFNFPEDRIKVIYNGVDERFRPLDDVNDVRRKYNLNYPFILHVGTLEPRKNIVRLIKAFYKVRKRGIKHKLVLAGKKGWKYEEIFETINKLGLQEEVILTGYVPDCDLPKLYNAADLFVYPSLYEGFGLPPLEAMACGCPVITSNTSSLPEIAEGAGVLVNPYDVNELANVIYEVLTNEALRKHMVKNGLKKAKTFSWEKCAKQTLEVYEDVCEE